MVLSELTAIPGVSGNERKIREKIISEAREYAHEVKTDKIGNVYAYKKGTAGSGAPVLLCAHMDEVGFIVKGVRDDGLIAYEPVGSMSSIDARIVVSKPVKVGENAVNGIIGAKAIHLQSPDERTQPLTHDKLFIDIGAKDKQSAEKLIKPGDFAAFDEACEEFGDGLVKSKALDDRVGVYNLLRILQNEYPVDVVCAFTVQEECGLFGARVAARQYNADTVIVLEGTSANDIGDVPEHFRVCSLNEGVAISFMDNSSIANVPLRSKLISVAEASGIRWQHKAYVAGGNDAGALQTIGGARAVCVLSVPCRYIHSPVSVAAFSDIDAQFALADAFLKSCN